MQNLKVILKFGKHYKVLFKTKSNFKKVAASRIVSWRIFYNLQEELCLKVAVDELFSCVLRTMRLISFEYIATPKIFKIILSPLFVSQEVVLLAFNP